MIFFIVAARNETSINRVKTSMAAPPTGGWPKDDKTVLAWNEVYRDFADLLAAVLAAGKDDPICGEMAKAAETKLKMSAPGDDASKDIFDETLWRWSHPDTGNIDHIIDRTPQPRVYPVDWSKASWLDDVTRAKIQDLRKEPQPKGFGSLDRSWRDQARIYHNITELARALYGEWSSSPIKRIEKLFALKLCSSNELVNRQKELVARYLEARALDKHFTKVANLDEYTKYYLSPNSRAQPDKDLLRELIDQADQTGNLSSTNASYGGALEEWGKLPPVVRYAILINGFRKMDVSIPTPNPRSSMTALGDLEFGCSYGMQEEKNTKNYVPKPLGDDTFATSWTRDEFAAHVQLYRVHLCPLWGGTSGHSLGCMNHWRERLGKRWKPQQDAVTIAAGFFVFWRLYYDKRITPVHLLAETFEATCSAKLGVSANTYRCKERTLSGDDIFTAIQPLCGAGGDLDPISLLWSLYGTFGASTDYAGIKGSINFERKIVGSKHPLPRWSYNVDTIDNVKIALDVKSFSE